MDAETRKGHSHCLILIAFSRRIQRNNEIRESKSSIVLIVTLFKILHQQKQMLETLMHYFIQPVGTEKDLHMLIVLNDYCRCSYNHLNF
jgi:hypothetical protein